MRTCPGRSFRCIWPGPQPAWVPDASNTSASAHGNGSLIGSANSRCRHVHCCISYVRLHQDLRGLTCLGVTAVSGMRGCYRTPWLTCTVACHMTRVTDWSNDSEARMGNKTHFRKLVCHPEACARHQQHRRYCRARCTAASAQQHQLDGNLAGHGVASSFQAYCISRLAPGLHASTCLHRMSCVLGCREVQPVLLGYRRLHIP